MLEAEKGYVSPHCSVLSPETVYLIHRMKFSEPTCWYLYCRNVNLSNCYRDRVIAVQASALLPM